jgi:putative membrane protein|tara:strand:- start:13782 stop:14606 length:825 start_codon:yes stop_codon:yes gene_type:complete
MGAADIVPGVSGGTMAFILGIYEELISAIALFGTKAFWSDIARGKIHHAFTLPKWGFLISVGAGILFAAATLAAPLEHVLETQPTSIWSFFFGLVFSSIFVVGARVKRWIPRRVVALIFGCLMAYVIVGLVPVQTPDAAWFLVLCGAIAICAMILPGISGAFLLVLLGKYEFVLSAVNNRDIGSIAYIGIGAVVGLIAFSQVLGWLFKRYHDLTVALLTGLMIGSLRKIWPWKEGTANILPDWNGDTAQIVGLMVLGAVLVIVVEVVAHRSRRV